MPCYVRLPAPHTTVEGYAVELLGYLSDHEAAILALLQSIVSFFTGDLWATLPPGWAAALSELSTEEIVCLSHPQAALPDAAETWPLSLQRFLRGSKRLSLPRTPGERDDVASSRQCGSADYRPVLPPSSCPFLPSIAEMVSQGADMAPPHSTERLLLRHIKPKKRHELQRLAQLIAKVAASSAQSKGDSCVSTNTVVDIGCGQGYLMRMLANMHGLDVVGVEAATENTDTASAKDARLRYELEKKQHVLERAAAAATTVTPPPDGVDVAPQSTEDSGRTGCCGGTSGGSVRFLNRMVSSVADVQRLITDAVSIGRPDHDDAATAVGATTPLPPPAEKDVTLVGLHACGILTATLLRGYAAAAASAAVAPPPQGYGTYSLSSLHPSPPSASTAAEAAATGVAAHCVVAVGCCYHKGGSDQSAGRAWYGQSARGDTKTALSTAAALPPPSSPLLLGSDTVLPWKTGDEAKGEGSTNDLVATCIDIGADAGADADAARRQKQQTTPQSRETPQLLLSGGVGQQDAVDDEHSSFPMSSFFADLLHRYHEEVVTATAAMAGSAETEVTANTHVHQPPHKDVGRWLGSSQVRELACHALEQYLLLCPPSPTIHFPRFASGQRLSWTV